MGCNFKGKKMNLFNRLLLIVVFITLVSGCANRNESLKTPIKSDKTSAITIQEIVKKHIPKPFSPEVYSSSLEYQGKWKGEIMPGLISEMKKNGWVELENERMGAEQFFSKEINGKKVKISVLPIEKGGSKNKSIVSTFVYFDLAEKKQEKVPVKAVYLVSKQGGELSQKELEAHPEVLIVHSGDELKSFIKENYAAIWIDKNAVKLINKSWFGEMPQKSYPTALLGYGSANYAFTLIGGFTLDRDIGLRPNPNITGFSIWMITSSPFEKPVHGYFLRGYPAPVTAEKVLSKTNKLLEGLNPENDTKIR